MLRKAAIPVVSSPGDTSASGSFWLDEEVGSGHRGHRGTGPAAAACQLTAEANAAAYVRDDGVVTSEPFQDAEPQPAAPGLSVLVEPHGDAIVLNVAGEIDLITAPQLGEAVNAAIAQRPTTLVVDLTSVDFLASAGMAVLIGSHQQAQESDLRFRIVATGSATFRPMELTGMTEEISIYPTRDEALAAN